MSLASQDLHRKETCRYSGEKLPAPFLDLGVLPLANSLIRPEDADKPEFACPLSLSWAPESGLVQLTHAVPASMMFEHYLYVSSTTQTFREHFAAYAKTVKKHLEGIESPLAVDIGSNDGLLVSCYRKEGMRAVGVDPAKNLAEEANRKGIETINRYFDAEAVRIIIEKHGKAHAISANNVFAHIDDIQSVCSNVAALLDERGIFIIEFPYLVTMVEELLFDMIYHEHVSYIALRPLSFLMERFGLQIFDVEKVASHGGSLRVFIQRKEGKRKVNPIVARMIEEELEGGYGSKAVYERFGRRVLAIREQFVRLVRDLRKEGKRIAGYGAPAKASTIVNFYGLDTKDIDYVVDDNPLKQNLLIPGVKIPIVPSSRLQDEVPDYIVIFAWNFAAEILKKIGHLREKGVRFLIPLPSARSGSPDDGSETFSFEVRNP